MPKPIYQAPIDDLDRRVKALEAENTSLKRTVSAAASSTTGESSVVTDDTLDGDGTDVNPLSAARLSGSIDGHFNDLSGSVDAHFTDLSSSIDSAIQGIVAGSGFLTGVAHDATLAGNGTGGSPLSAAPLSGTINARFVNVTGSLISGLASTYSSLQAGSTASIASLSGTVDARFQNWTYTSIAVTGSLSVLGSITGTDRMVIGRAATDIIHSSSLMFSGTVPQLEVVTGQGTSSFAEAVTIRHRLIDGTAVQRTVGLLLKLSNEGTSTESRKMGGLVLQSNAAFANAPDLMLVTAEEPRLTVSAGGVVTASGSVTVRGSLTGNLPIKVDVSNGNGSPVALASFIQQGAGAQSPYLQLQSNTTVGLKIGMTSSFQDVFIDNNYSSANEVGLWLRGTKAFYANPGQIHALGDAVVTGSITGGLDASFRRDVTVGRSLSAVGAANQGTVVASQGWSNQTANTITVSALSNGTYDASAGNLSTIGIQANVFASRSLGTGTLNQIAVVGTVSGSTSVATSVGILGQAEGSLSASYGVYGTAFRSQGVNYGGYFTNENVNGLPGQGVNYALFATGTVKFIGDVYVTGNLFAPNIPAVGPLYSSLQAGITSSVDGIYSTILLGTTASDAAVQTSLKAGVTASLQSYYTAILAGTSASDAAVQTSLKAGVTASLQSYYSTILLGTSASDAAVQASLKSGVTASVGAAFTSLQTGVTASVNGIYSAILVGTSASDAGLLELRYPTSPQLQQAAVGFGQWTSGSAGGWHFDETTGSLFPAYGTSAFNPSGSAGPTYRNPGPRGASDASMGIRLNGTFAAGNDFDAGATSDVAFALVVMQTGSGGGWCIPLQKQLGTSLGPGWQLSVTPGPSTTINFILTGSVGAGGAQLQATINTRPEAPFVIVGGYSRATGLARLGTQNLTTGVQVLSSSPVGAVGDMTNVERLIMNTNVSGSDLWLAYGAITVGSGSALGLPENIGQATQNFAQAVNRVQGTVYSTVTGTLSLLSGTIDARFKSISSVLGDLTVPGSLTGSGDATFGRNVGIGTAAPNVNLHVVRSSTSGITPLAATAFNVESNGAVRLSITGPQEKAIYFASTASNADGAILYDQSVAPRGFQLRTGGNTTQVTLDSLGYFLAHKNLGVSGSLTGSGDVTFGRDLRVGQDVFARSLSTVGATDVGCVVASNGFGPHSGNMMIGSFQSTGRFDTTSGIVASYGVYGRSASSRSNGPNAFGNVGVGGIASGSATSNVGVVGQAEGGSMSASYGVFGVAFGSTGQNYGGYFTNENPYGTGNPGINHALYATGTVKFIGDLYVSGTIIATNVTIPGGSVGGTGTTNKVSKFTAAQTIGDSNITDSGTGVSVAGPLTASLDLLVSRNELVSGDSRTVGSLTGSGDALMSRHLSVLGNLVVGGSITGTVGKFVETAIGRTAAQSTLIVFTTGTYDTTAGPIIHSAFKVASSPGKTGGNVFLNTAVEGNASNSPFLNVGVSGQATGSATQNNAIYGNATGATTNWAGYFDGGNVHVEHDLEVLGNITGANFMPSASIDAQRVTDGLDWLRSCQYFDDYITDKWSVFSTVGGATTAFQPFEPGHPGIVRATTSTSGSSVVDIYMTDAANAGVMRYPGNSVMYETCLRIPTVDNGTNNAHRRAGIWVQTSLDIPSDGVWFEVNRTRYGDNEFRLRTAATSSQNQMRTGVTAANGRWYRLKLNWAPDGDAVTGSIFCSGSLISTISTRTYISNAAAQSPGFFQTKTLGASAVTTDLDYMVIQATFTGSRI